MRKQIKLVFHPESPGEQIFVYRTWWQRLWRPRNFATLSEAIRHADKGLSRISANWKRSGTIEDMKKFNMDQYPIDPDECYPTKLD